MTSFDAAVHPHPGCQQAAAGGSSPAVGGSFRRLDSRLPAAGSRHRAKLGIDCAPEDSSRPEKPPAIPSLDADCKTPVAELAGMVNIDAALPSRLVAASPRPLRRSPRTDATREAAEKLALKQAVARAKTGAGKQEAGVIDLVSPDASPRREVKGEVMEEGRESLGIIKDDPEDGSALKEDPEDTALPVAGYAQGARRGSRDRKSRVVWYKGQPVLRSNLYDLEGGEPSVFDRELKKGAGLIDPMLSEHRPVTQKPAPLKTEKPPKVCAVKHEESLAMKHNRLIRADKDLASSRQALFLSHHQKVLQPFLTAKSMARLQSRAGTATKFVPPPPVETTPSTIKADMRDYQLDALRWMTKMFSNGVSCILGDEMGLGKTLQSIAFLAALKERGVGGPALVVVPLSVMASWMQELSKWCPTLKAVRLHTLNAQEVARLKREFFSDPSSFDVAVTTYEMVTAKDLSPLLRSLVWRVLILDEGHRIKNESTLCAQGLRSIRHQFCLLLTGTPLQNNLHELYALLNFLLPEIFDDSSPFDAAFDLSKNQVDNEQLMKAHHLMKLLCLRRLKSTINIRLPPKLETRINCPLTEMQLFWYQRLLVKNSSAMLNSLAKTTTVEYDKNSNDWRKLQMLLCQLRKCSNHPYKFPGAEPAFDGSTDEEIVTASGKMMVLDRLLSKLHERGHRVVLFSQFNTMLDIIEDYLVMRGYKYKRLDGSTNRVQRRIDIAVFNKNTSFFIYILNTRAGGLGINLQSADTCILYDSDWNPQVDVQAMARVHRIGQTKPVHIYRLYSGNTVEERVLLRSDKKLYLDKMVNRDFENGADDLEKLDMKEMLSILQFGADRIFQGDGGAMPTDSELDAIMDRSGMLANQEKEGAATQAVATATDFGGEQQTFLKSAKLNAACFGDGGIQQTPISSFLLNGKDYAALAAENLQDVAKEWHKKRSRNTTTIKVGEYMVSVSSIRDEEQKRAWDQAQPKKRQQKQMHGHSSDCQHCWDGGELFLCDSCPAAYHAACLGMTSAEMHSMKTFRCPHHSCAGCGRKAGAAGGLLLACEGCSNSYCEDCMPDDIEIVGESERFVNMDFRKPSTVCYIQCNAACVEWCCRPHFSILGTDLEWGAGFKLPKHSYESLS